jgi:hypothetical protein
MRLIRLTIALAFLEAANALFRAGRRILADAKTERAAIVPARYPADWILLSSIAGMFICGLWIMMTWRAAG